MNRTQHVHFIIHSLLWGFVIEMTYCDTRGMKPNIFRPQSWVVLRVAKRTSCLPYAFKERNSFRRVRQSFVSSVHFVLAFVYPTWNVDSELMLHISSFRIFLRGARNSYWRGLVLNIALGGGNHVCLYMDVRQFIFLQGTFGETGNWRYILLQYLKTSPCGGGLI
jgi:hypothetical protein